MQNEILLMPAENPIRLSITTSMTFRCRHDTKKKLNKMGSQGII